MIDYADFVSRLNAKVKSDEDFYVELLKTVIKSPHRYTGIFRLTNAKTKLIQNVTQSREIKFGSFMEEIVAEYIALMGYHNLDKNIGNDEAGNALSADQVFEKGNGIYLIEQKIRDDHDSTKKRGQFENFRKKYTLLKSKYPHRKIIASMWFIDENLKKNKNYYNAEITKETIPNVALSVLYGQELFSNIFSRKDIWDEICIHLQRNKLERTDEILQIPDFDASKEIFAALKTIKTNNPNALVEILECESEYLKAPSYAYQIGKFAVNRDGNIECPDEATEKEVENLIKKLTWHGFERILDESTEEVLKENEIDTTDNSDISEEVPENPAAEPEAPILPEGDFESDEEATDKKPEPIEENSEHPTSEEIFETAEDLEKVVDFPTSETEDAQLEETQDKSQGRKLVIELPGSYLDEAELSRVRAIVASKASVLKKALETNDLCKI